MGDAGRGMREGGCVRGEVSAAIGALPRTEGALTHPNAHPGAAEGQETGCSLEQSAAIL